MASSNGRPGSDAAIALPPNRRWIGHAFTILFGILVIVNPATGGLSVILMIASWAIITGVLKVIFAFKVKNLPERMANRFV